MHNPLERVNAGCQEFLDELESLSPETQGTELTKLLDSVSARVRQHGDACESCRQAAIDFGATREALQGLKAAGREERPWFVTRVMSAIRSREKEIEERREGVWISVRRLAPRLVALCAVLLIIGSTWAVHLRRTDQARRAQVRPVEALFEVGPSIAANDDVMISAGETRP